MSFIGPLDITKHVSSNQLMAENKSSLCIPYQPPTNADFLKIQMELPNDNFEFLIIFRT